MTDPVYIFSGGLWQLRDEVGLIAGLEPKRARWRAGPSGAVAGWGHKPSANRARAAAQRHGLPYLAFEDGFLRSLRPGPVQRPVSMIMDRSGIYYDARQPSDLETMIASGRFTTEESSRAAEVIREITIRRLSKYNHGSDRLDDLPRGSPLVLVIDQTKGDESVAGGLASDCTFIRMIDAAASENPGAILIAKLHPEVIAGTKAGYLRQAAARHGAKLLATNASPWALLDLGPRVYTVSSQFGFDALLAGCAVTCFGAPFYAGWGLTDDRLAIPRRNVKRNITEISAAVYLRYCHYFDVWRRNPVDVLTAIDQLDFLRRRFLANASPVIGYRIARWKRKAVSTMLDGPAGPPRFTRSLKRAHTMAKQGNGAIAAWGMEANRLRRRLDMAGQAILTVEDGFIRSAGLGAAFVQPLSLVFDSRGIYYDPSGPSDIEHLLASGKIASADVSRAASLRQRIVADRVTKYNLPGAATALEVPAGRDVVLVPGQVADDAAVLAGPWTAAAQESNINTLLLKAVRRRNPSAFVIFKPHPDVERLGRRGALDIADYNFGADHVARGTSLDMLFPLVSRIETYSSLAGFEALMRGLQVTVHGLPFYSGWGVTEDLENCARRGRSRSLDELVAAALICYPRYWDPVSGLPCPPDVVLDRLADLRQRPGSWMASAGRVAGKTVIAWHRLMRAIPAGKETGT